MESNPPQIEGLDLKSANLEEKVIEALRTCFDPDIPVNIYEIGLVYKIDVKPDGDVVIQMTLTSPACPVAGSLPPEVETKVREVPGDTSSKAEVVWDPPCTTTLTPEAAMPPI